MTFKFRVLTTASPKQPLVKNITKPNLKPHALDLIICQKLLTMNNAITKHIETLLIATQKRIIFYSFSPNYLSLFLSLSSFVAFPFLSLPIES